MTEWIQTALLCLTIFATTRVHAQQPAIGYKPAPDADSRFTIHRGDAGSRRKTKQGFSPRHRIEGKDRVITVLCSSASLSRVVELKPAFST